MRGSNLMVCIIIHSLYSINDIGYCCIAWKKMNLHEDRYFMKSDHKGFKDIDRILEEFLSNDRDLIEEDIELVTVNDDRKRTNTNATKSLCEDRINSPDVISISSKKSQSETTCTCVQPKYDPLTSLNRNNSRVILNVSGEIYETFRQTLQRYPNSLLGDFNKMFKYFCPKRRMYQFYRNRLVFDSILFFYQSQGKLACPPGVQFEVFIEECRFFQLPEDIIRKRFGVELELLHELKRQTSRHNKTSTATTMKKIWKFVDNPSSSCGAMIYFIFSIILTFLSVCFACFETNSTVRKHFENIIPNVWKNAELISAIFFTVEFHIRLLTSPNKLTFAKSVLNWIDVACVTFFFINRYVTKGNDLTYHRLSHVFRILKILCLFRLTKTFKALRISLATVRLLSHDYATLLFCFYMSFLSGATVIYFAERHRDVFNAIPKCFYWAIQTVTAVGDGAAIPNTRIGQLVATGYMVSGIVTFTLPTIYVMNKFSPVYQKLHGR